MNDFWRPIIAWSILVGTPLFALASTILFIMERVRARRQRRRMKKRYLVAFILGVTLLLLLIAFILLTMYLFSVAMRSM